MNTQKKVNVLGQDFLIGFPNVSQHMEIEAMKHSLTNGQYGEMVRAGVKTTDRNLDLVDSISVFSVLIPTLKDRLGDSTWRNMDMKTGLQIAKAYREEYYPWYNEIMTQLDKEYKEISNTAKNEPVKAQ